LSNKITKKILLSKQPLYLFLCKGTFTCTTTTLESRVSPLEVQELLKVFDQVFQSEGPVGHLPFWE